LETGVDIIHAGMMAAYLLWVFVCTGALELRRRKLWRRHDELPKRYPEIIKPTMEERLQEIINEPGGLARIAQGMQSPIRMNMDYQRVGRRFFSVYEETGFRVLR